MHPPGAVFLVPAVPAAVDDGDQARAVVGAARGRESVVWAAAHEQVDRGADLLAGRALREQAGRALGGGVHSAARGAQLQHVGPKKIVAQGACLVGAE